MNGKVRNGEKMIFFSQLGLIFLVIVSFLDMASYNFTLYYILSMLIRIFLILSLFPLVKFDKSNYSLLWGLFFCVVIAICLLHGSLSYALLIFVLFMYAVIYTYNVSFLNIILRILEFTLWFQLIGAYLEILFPSLYEMIFMRVLNTDQYAIVNKFHNISGYCCGFTVQPAILATFTAIGFGFYIIKAFFTKRKKYGIFAVLFFVCIIMTSKRAHLLFAILSVIVCYVALKINKKNIIKFFKVIIMTLIIIMTMYFVYKKFDAFNSLERFFELFNFFKSSRDLDSLSSGRMELITVALDYFKSSPIVGIGFNQFMYRNGVAVHNVFFQYLCEGGVLTFVLFILASMVSFVNAFKTTKYVYVNNIKEWKFIITFSLYILSFMFLYCMTGNPMFDYMFLYIIVLGLLLLHSCKIYLKRNCK
ncbi:MAG: O-antigen ligase family protein [Wujia sp.]